MLTCCFKNFCTLEWTVCFSGCLMCSIALQITLPVCLWFCFLNVFESDFCQKDSAPLCQIGCDNFAKFILCLSELFNWAYHQNVSWNYLWSATLCFCMKTNLLPYSIMWLLFILIPRIIMNNHLQDWVWSRCTWAEWGSGQQLIDNCLHQE